MATKVGQRRWRVVLEQNPETGERAALAPRVAWLRLCKRDRSGRA
ncbi:hypothetical protein [Synechococcus sp. RC10A2]